MLSPSPVPLPTGLVVVESTGVMAPDCSVFIRLRRDRFRCKYSCPSSALRVGVGLKLEGEGEYAAGQRLDSVRANLG